jgi:ATP-dependent Clp protease ATP-binding subunit ClpX
MMARDKKLYCSFCGKEKMDVKVMVAGGKAFICDECIEACIRIVKGEEGDFGMRRA